jgi:hypothetical protein
MTTTGDVDVTLTATNQPLLVASSSLMLSKALVLNTDTTNRKLWLSRVNTLAVAHLIVSGSGASAYTIAPGQTQTLPLSGFVLSPTESLNGYASVTGKVNISLSYVIPS